MVSWFCFDVDRGEHHPAPRSGLSTAVPYDTRYWWCRWCCCWSASIRPFLAIGQPREHRRHQPHVRNSALLAANSPASQSMCYNSSCAISPLSEGPSFFIQSLTSSSVATCSFRFLCFPVIFHLPFHITLSRPPAPSLITNHPFSFYISLSRRISPSLTTY